LICFYPSNTQGWNNPGLKVVNAFGVQNRSHSPQPFIAAIHRTRLRRAFTSHAFTTDGVRRRGLNAAAFKTTPVRRLYAEGVHELQPRVGA
jgi:hypothetical protein